MFQSWQDSKIWLGGIGIGLVLIHLLLIWKLTGQTDQILLSGLFWGAIAQTLWQQRQMLCWQSDGISTAIAVLLISLTLLKSVSLFWVEASFVRLLPLLIAVSLGLLAAGWRIHQFWRELLLVIPLILPRGLLVQGIDATIGLPIRTLTAQCSSFMLHYLGFSVIRSGTIIQLPNGAVDVLLGCTSVPILILLLQLVILFITFFPIDSDRIMRLLIGTVAIAFIVSSSRIALLAVVVAERTNFDYWHGTQGAQIFSTIAILLFGEYCRSLLTITPPPQPHASEQPIDP